MVQKYPRSYYIDLLIAKSRRKIKSSLPESLVKRINQKKNLAGKTALFNLFEKNVVPWSSPNVWHEIVNFYQDISWPVLFEYGMGASTLSHFNLLAKKGGIYYGVEVNPEWFWNVVNAIIKTATETFQSVKIETTVQNSDEANGAIDARIESGCVTTILKLRSSQSSYVNCLDTHCDLVIVDGAYRKACVRRALETSFLRTGGLLILMEAGRGSPDWWEGKLDGENDYSQELRMMLDRGGRMIDGNGIDSWPNCSRNSPRPVSYFNPSEACMLLIADK